MIFNNASGRSSLEWRKRKKEFRIRVFVSIHERSHELSVMAHCLLFTFFLSVEVELDFSSLYSSTTCTIIRDVRAR